MGWNKRVTLRFLAAGSTATAVVVLSFLYYAGARSPAPDESDSPPAEAVVSEPELTTESLPIKRRDTLEKLLIRAGVDRAARTEAISAVEGAFDVRKFRAGSQLTLSRLPEGTFQGLEYVIDPDHRLQLSISDGAFAAAVVEVPGVIEVVPACGTIEGSLFESIARTGERPELAMQIADIFAWDMDFYTDPRPGDTFCMLIEKKVYANGQPPTYRRILAAKYNNAGSQFDAYLFPDADGKPQYYSQDGRSLKAAFLRSPLEFSARVSSRFSTRRLHPVLKVYRPHLGTDYAAPTGTPVQAVASGRVTFSGRSGGSGNLIKIKHGAGFETQYLHLSRRLVKSGQRVEQGQRIGSVGATGLTTGPHLDFRLRKNGRHMNFERFKPPRLSKISAEHMGVFAADRDRFGALMEPGYSPGNMVMAGDTSSQAALPVD